MCKCRQPPYAFQFYVCRCKLKLWWLSFHVNPKPTRPLREKHFSPKESHQHVVTIHINQYDLVNVIHIHDLGWFVGLIYSAFRQGLKWLIFTVLQLFHIISNRQEWHIFCIADLRCTIFYIQIFFSLFWRKALCLLQLNDNSSRTDLVYASTRAHISIHAAESCSF